MIDLTNGNEMESDLDLTVSDHALNTEVQEIEDNMALMTYLNIPTSPEREFVKYVLSGCASKTLHSVLNSTSVFYAGRFQGSAPQNEIMTLSNSGKQDEIPTNSPNTQPEVRVSNVLHSTIDSLRNLLESISNLLDNSEPQSSVTQALDIADFMKD